MFSGNDCSTNDRGRWRRGYSPYPTFGNVVNVFSYKLGHASLRPVKIEEPQRGRRKGVKRERSFNASPVPMHLLSKAEVMMFLVCARDKPRTSSPTWTRLFRPRSPDATCIEELYFRGERVDTGFVHRHRRAVVPIALVHKSVRYDLIEPRSGSRQ